MCVSYNDEQSLENGERGRSGGKHINNTMIYDLQFKKYKCHLYVAQYVYSLTSNETSPIGISVIFFSLKSPLNRRSKKGDCEARD
ncbi:hypothetical protein PRIPAC_93855 [Pristionchus pacificus]|uniref:Uncharacterized protein n=1 Tax=Pristionchus pacificus TaxID=54126 RepID=A0A2A6BIR2_PRIPA|nr:hypothetical protein PRIPAC_93855 [Pristionchus pacificus]|eukprot:PDM65718.1 hypothetical protein PRIPAC_45632 [Pristionchus pacificus]